jgi:hypothetical protein
VSSSSKIYVMNARRQRAADADGQGKWPCLVSRRAEDRLS